MYAIIDLGSNSFHLLIAEYRERGFAIVDRCSEKIQLADGLAREGFLTPAAMDRGLNCLQFFKGVLARHPIRQLRVVATQALRQAANASDFTAKAQSLGFKVEIISGTREAELIFRGICDSLPRCQGNRLVIDIGGASTEIAVGNEREVLFAESLHMGCVSWRDRFFAEGVEYGRRSADARSAAHQMLEPFMDTLSALDWSEVYASSGSAKMLSTIALANQWSDGEITAGSVDQIEDAISRVRHHHEITLKGLKPERQDLLAPGVSIMATLMNHLAINEVIYSSTALREGILGELSKRRVDYHLRA